MPSTLALKETDPHDIFVIEPDVVLAARADHPSVSPANDAAAVESVLRAAAVSEKFAGPPAPSVDATFRAAAADKATAPAGSAIGRHARRAGLLCLMALCSAVAVAGWEQYGNTARAMAANWMPTFALTSPPPNADAPGQPALPIQQTTATDQTTVQPVAPAQPATNVVQPVAAIPAETAQLLQSMSQQIAELKANVAELKAGQAQMSREIGKASEARSSEPAKPVQARAAEQKTAEPNLRPKLPPRKPKPAFAPVQAAVAPPLPPPTPAPMTLQPRALPPPPPEYGVQSDDGPVVRPPMPLR